MEALLEFIYPTPVLGKIDLKDNYEDVYIKTDRSDRETNSEKIILYEKLYRKSQLESTNYFTSSQKIPTAQKIVFSNQLEEIVESERPGIEEKELKLIHFIAPLAGEESKELGGLILETFGGFDIGLVLEGNFSIGNNDTLITIIKSFIETFIRRGIEWGLYNTLNDSYSLSLTVDRNIELLLDNINIEDKIEH